MTKSKNKKLESKNKKLREQKERSGTELKEYYSVAFALILTGYMLRILPSFLDTAWYGVAGWLCVYAASCIIACHSRRLGKQYGVSLLVTGAAGITLALLLSEFDIKTHLQNLNLSFLNEDNIKTFIFVQEGFALVLLICGSFGIVSGVGTFLENAVEQKKQQHKLLQVAKM